DDAAFGARDGALVADDVAAVAHLDLGLEVAADEHARDRVGEHGAVVILEGALELHHLAGGAADHGERASQPGFDAGEEAGRVQREPVGEHEEELAAVAALEVSGEVAAALLRLRAEAARAHRLEAQAIGREGHDADGVARLVGAVAADHAFGGASGQRRVAGDGADAVEERLLIVPGGGEHQHQRRRRAGQGSDRSRGGVAAGGMAVAVYALSNPDAGAHLPHTRNLPKFPACQAAPSATWRSYTSSTVMTSTITSGPAKRPIKPKASVPPSTATNTSSGCSCKPRRVSSGRTMLSTVLTTSK